MPDVIVKFRNPAGGEGVFVVEVGFSETYSELVQDVHMWLNGKRDATIAVLVKLDESPAYRCPIRDLNGQDLERLELLGIPRPSDFNAVGEYGLILHNGMVWVGRVSGFMEVWGRDPGTGLATRIGDRIVSHYWCGLCFMLTSIPTGSPYTCQPTRT